MARRPTGRQDGVRARVAAAAARLMAEDGIDDFGLAKRKAARQLGVEAGHAMPGNDEIESELRAYLALYQAEEHPARERELLVAAVAAMRWLSAFRPYLVGSVLSGAVGPYARIELQLFPESAKEVEIFLIDHNMPYQTAETRHYSGGRAQAVTLIDIEWQGLSLRLAVLDPRAERVALRRSPAGRIPERAGIAEVEQRLHSLQASDDSS